MRRGETALEQGRFDDARGTSSACSRRCPLTKARRRSQHGLARRRFAARNRRRAVQARDSGAAAARGRSRARRRAGRPAATGRRSARRSIKPFDAGDGREPLAHARGSKRETLRRGARGPRTRARAHAARRKRLSRGVFVARGSIARSIGHRGRRHLDRRSGALGVGRRRAHARKR